MSLWKTLVAEHAEPDTLKVISGRNGLHLYFKTDQTIGLKKLNNFQGLTLKNVSYMLDGRRVGGVIFALPTDYSANGKLLQYSWVLEPVQGERRDEKGIPRWLANVINTGRDKQPAGPSIALPNTIQSDHTHARKEDSQPTNGEREPSSNQAAGFKMDSAVVREVQELLRKHAANDSTALYGGSTTLPNGNRSFQFCVKGPRTCYLGSNHNGSNNFTVI
jgi:hypothetical protein